MAPFVAPTVKEPLIVVVVGVGDGVMVGAAGGPTETTEEVAVRPAPLLAVTAQLQLPVLRGLTRMGEADTPVALVTTPPPDAEQLAVNGGVPLGEPVSVKLMVAFPLPSTEIEVIAGVAGGLPPPVVTVRVPVPLDEA